MPSNADLEAIVAADPFDENAWSVLEDWILETGDPRAAVVLAERAKEDAKPAYSKVRKRLLSDHPQWVLIKNRLSISSWRAGYITRLWWKDGEDHELETELYADFLATPAARLVRETTVTIEPLIDRWLELLAEAPAGRSLRDLTIGFYDRYGIRDRTFSGSVIAPFNLTSLTTTWSTILTSSPELARLHELHVAHTAAMYNERLFDMVFTELRELEMKASTYGTLDAILDGKAVPRLKVLRLHDPYDELPNHVEALRTSELLPQLEAIHFGCDPITGETERVEPGSILGKEFSHLSVLTVPTRFK